MSQERNHQLMQEGEAAIVTRSIVEPMIQDLIRDKLSIMITAYRNGDTGHTKLVGMIAEIAALEGILTDLNTKQVRANVARQKEMMNATP